MFSEEEEYQKRNEELNKILANPRKAKKIEKLLKEITDITKCDVDVTFSISPYVDNYLRHQDTDKFKLPTLPTLKMENVLAALNKENGEFDVYIDPIYLNKGVNEIVNIFLTTKDNKIIIVPISNKKSIKL